MRVTPDCDVITLGDVDVSGERRSAFESGDCWGRGGGGEGEGEGGRGRMMKMGGLGELGGLEGWVEGFDNRWVGSLAW